MPPPPSLPLRDGRLGVSAHHNEPYYSNEGEFLMRSLPPVSAYVDVCVFVCVLSRVLTYTVSRYPTPP